ncbi:MAG: phosphomannomutase [Halioglobus sp.]|jgi:phosphomannomutase
MDSKIRQWLDKDPDAKSREELQQLVDSANQAELDRRFSGRLQFGTAGLRGVVGAGPAMMNALVIRQTSAGLGQYILQELNNAAAKGVLVAYDGRLDSEQFAQETASVLAALGITVYITPDVAATPIAGFCVLSLGCAAGVVVTASHNPPEYNGFKVYWENGAQIIPPHDAGIAKEIERAAKGDVPWISFDDGVSSGKIVVLEREFYRRYIDAIQSSPLFSSNDGERSVSIAYTAMHGVGASVAEALLAEAGFDSVYSVASQREPDGNFPTVNFPNPEEPGAMDAVIALAGEHQATLACANDPDADRLAVAVRTQNGDYQMLTGDMIGVLLADYLLAMEHSFVPIVCTTIVSSSLLGKMAAVAGANFHETLTGFKWLANTAMQDEDEAGSRQFLFGYEEALGYAPGRLVRDKDGLSALLAFAQMTDKLAQRGLTVMDQLENIYRSYGIYLTAQRSIALQSGSASIGDTLRATPPKSIAGIQVDSTDDLSNGARTFANGDSESLNFPASDVLIYRLADNSRVVVRPSGTEPKVKCYYEVVEKLGEETYAEAMSHASERLSKLIDMHQKSL